MEDKPTLKSIKKDLNKYHYALNHEEVLPEQWARMNHPHHILVCWVNTLIGLYNSGNVHLIPIFIGRVLKRLKEAEGKPVGESYRKLVELYCCQLTYYLMNYTVIEGEDITKWVPEETLFKGITCFPSKGYPSKNI